MPVQVKGKERHRVFEGALQLTFEGNRPTGHGGSERQKKISGTKETTDKKSRKKGCGKIQEIGDVLSTDQTEREARRRKRSKNRLARHVLYCERSISDKLQSKDLYKVAYQPDATSAVPVAAVPTYVTAAAATSSDISLCVVFRDIKFAFIVLVRKAHAIRLSVFHGSK
jgi:hypothetical protein